VLFIPNLDNIRKRFKTIEEMISIFQKPRMLLFMLFMIFFETRFSSSFSKNTTNKPQTQIKKQSSGLPFQNSSPLILQNIFKYLNLEDFATIQSAYQKSKSPILHKQFLKISKTFSMKTLQHKLIFEFTINSENLSPTKYYFFKPKPIQFSNFIQHVMIYHEFRFISYIDESFSIENKLKNTKQYMPITFENSPIAETNENPHFVTFLGNFTNHFLYFAIQMNDRLRTLFINEKISLLDYRFSINPEETTYFVSLDKTCVIRFLAPNIFFHHIPTGKVYKAGHVAWELFVNINVIKKLKFEPLKHFGEFLPSCYHPKVKQTIFEKKTKNGEQDKVCIQFKLSCDRCPSSVIDYTMCLTSLTDHQIHIDFYQ